MMVIKKKTLLITTLVFLLVVVGYLNHQLNKQSLLDSSSEYQKHEESNLANMENSVGDNSVTANTDNTQETFSSSVGLVDSKRDDISQLTQATNNEIDKSMENQNEDESVNYFVDYRVSRDQLRSSLLERLNGIISNEKTTDEVRSAAQNEILRLGKIEENELYIEGLIKGKGFEDVVVFLKENSARVIVDIVQLSEQDVMKILEVVKNETNIEPINIKINKKY